MYGEEGWSLQQIADQLNDDHVPTATMWFKRGNASPTWYNRTVNNMIHHPVNRGQLVNNFGELRNPEDPSITELSADRIVNSAGVEPLVSDTQANVLAARRHRNKEGYYRRKDSVTDRALLGGKLAKCGICRKATLRVHGSYAYGRYYLYYGCLGHDNNKSSCPGFSLSAKALDPWAWNSVRTALFSLTQPGNNSYLDILARLDADRQAAQPHGDPLADLRRARDEFKRQLDMLMQDLLNLQTTEGRTFLHGKIDEIAPQIAKADAQIAAMELKQAKQTERAVVLRDFLSQFHRYVDLITLLDPQYEDDMPIMKQILRAIGAVFTVEPDVLSKAAALGVEPEVEVELTLTPTATLPWLSAEDIAQLVEERRGRSKWLDLDTEPTGDVQLPLVPVDPSEPRGGGGIRGDFGTPGSSRRRWRGRSRSRRAARRWPPVASWYPASPAAAR
jgi:hypothetical protein